MDYSKLHPIVKLNKLVEMLNELTEQTCMFEDHLNPMDREQYGYLAGVIADNKKLIYELKQARIELKQVIYN